MLSASPLSVTYSFADIEYNQEGKIVQNDSKVLKSTQEERKRAILTEKIVNGKLEVQQYALPDDISKEDLQRMLSLEGQISDWAYVNYKAYHSGIVLFDGKASRVGENLWEISRSGFPYPEEVQMDTQFNGISSDSQITMPGTTLEKDLSYRVIFSGKVVETNEETIFAISFMNSGFKNPEIGQNIKFLQMGDSSINSEKSVCINQKVTSSTFVK